MTERQIDRIRKAETAAQELREAAAQIRQELDSAKTEDPSQLGELLEAVEGLEKEAERLEDALGEWRKDIH
jgi:exonuclease VII small subunit